MSTYLLPQELLCLVPVDLFTVPAATHKQTITTLLIPLYFLLDVMLDVLLYLIANQMVAFGFQSVYFQPCWRGMLVHHFVPD